MIYAKGINDSGSLFDDKESLDREDTAMQIDLAGKIGSLLQAGDATKGIVLLQAEVFHASPS